MEKLIVEFEVENEIERNYGYVEKFLAFRGESTPYKAIVKNGTLLAIVSRRYHLIENERIVEICRRIAEKHGFVFDYVDGLTRVHIFLDRGDVGVAVHNSVDGSFALRVDATVKIGNTTKAIFRIKDVKQVYKKHFGSAKIVVDDLEKIINEIVNKAEDFKYFIEKLETMQAKNYEEELKMLEDLLPKKYVAKVLQTAKYRTLNGRAMTLKEVYERIATDIWSADIDMRTKINYFDNLNQVMFAIAGWS